MYMYKKYIYTHARVHMHVHMLVFNKQGEQGIQTQRCRLSPLFVLNFFRIYYPDLPYVIGGLIQEERTRSLTHFNLPSCNVCFFFSCSHRNTWGSRRTKPF